MDRLGDLSQFDGLDQCNFTVEEHGRGYALYNDRGPNRHGWNLCLLTEFDQSGPKIRAAIQSIPDLLAALKESRKENEELRERIQKAIEEINQPYQTCEEVISMCNDVLAILEDKQ